MAAIIVSLLIAGAYCWYLIDHMATYASASDASGYFNSAKLLAHEHGDVAIRAIPDLQPPQWDWYYQQPLGFETKRETGRMVPTYPVGLPLQLLGASTLVGWAHATTLLNVVSALATAFFFVLVARRFGLSLYWAIAGAVWLWMCPLYIFFTLQPMSDMPATAWTLATIWFSFKTRDHRAWSLAAGAAIGMSVLIRPTNLLLVFPALFILGLDWKRGIGLMLGGLPFAIFLALYNLRLYDQIFTTGYGNIDNLLSIKFVPHNVAHFAQWIVILLTPMILLAPAVPWIRGISSRYLVLLTLWFTTFVGFYVFYFHSGETWWYLRFILPAFPAMIIAALLVAQTLFTRVISAPLRAGLAILLMAAVVTAEARRNRTLDTTTIGRHDRTYFEAASWLRTHVPAGSVMAAMQMSGALHFYTDFPLVRYDLVSSKGMAQLRQSAQTHGFSIYAPLFPFEKSRVVDANLGGTWEKVDAIKYGSTDYITIWRLKL